MINFLVPTSLFLYFFILFTLYKNWSNYAVIIFNIQIVVAILKACQQNLKENTFASLSVAFVAHFVISRNSDFYQIAAINSSITLAHQL